MLDMEYKDGGTIDGPMQTVYLAEEPENPSPTRPNEALQLHNAVSTDPDLRVGAQGEA